MAIKGKKKSQKSRAKRPAAPKPVIVVPKKPVMTRRWVQVTAAAVIAGLFGLGFGYGFGKQHKVNETAAAKQNAQAVVKTYQRTLDPALKDVGTPDVSTGTFKAFQSLPADAAAIKNGSGTAAAAKDAATVASTATKAGTTLGALDLTQAIGSKTIPDSVRTGLADSQKRLTEALALYAHAASDLKEASTSTGAAQSTSLASSQQLTSLANDIISDGYGKYIIARTAAGLGLDQAAKDQLIKNALQSPPPGTQPTG